MSLLKNDGSVPDKTYRVIVSKWPALTISDGWYFGIGFGLAMAVAVPLIILLLSCVIGIGLSTIGFSLGSLLGG